MNEWIAIWLIILLLMIPKVNNFIYNQSIFSLKCYKLLKLQIEGFGYKYSYTKHFVSIIFTLIIITTTTILFSLKIQLTMILILISSFVLSQVIKTQFIHAYEENKFYNLTIYLNQFCSVFKTNGKILITLKEIYSSLDGEIKKDVQQAILEIESGSQYDITLDKISKKYNSSIIRNLHMIVSEVEQNGAFIYKEGIDIILDDTDDWIEDVYSYRNIKKSNRNKIIIMCIMSIFVGVMAKNMIPISQLQILYSSDFYQYCCFAFHNIILFTIYCADKEISEKWIKEDE